MPAEVFLLYAREDYRVAAGVARELLRRFDIRVLNPPFPEDVSDPSEFPGDVEQDDSLTEHLDNDDVIFVVLLSIRSRESKRLAARIDMVAKTRQRVIPCLVGPGPRRHLFHEFHEYLAQLQFLDLGRDERTLDADALEALGRVLSEAGNLPPGDAVSEPLALTDPSKILKLMLLAPLAVLLCYFLFASESASRVAGEVSAFTGALATNLFGEITSSRLAAAGLAFCAVALLASALRHLFELTAAWLITRNFAPRAQPFNVRRAYLKVWLTLVGVFWSSLFAFNYLRPGPITGPPETGHVVGRVMDARGQAMSGLEVSIINGPHTTTSPRGGDFELDRAPAGDQVLVVRSPSGKGELRRPILIRERQKTEVNVIYSPEVGRLGFFSITEPLDGDFVMKGAAESRLRVSGRCDGLSESFGDFGVWVLVRPARHPELSWVQYPGAVIDRERGVWQADIQLDNLTSGENLVIFAVAASADSGINRTQVIPQLELLAAPYVVSNYVEVVIR